MKRGGQELSQPAEPLALRHEQGDPPTFDVTLAEGLPPGVGFVAGAVRGRAGAPRQVSVVCANALIQTVDAPLSPHP